LYLFSLPFTLVRDLSWITIPVVTVVAFTLMGIEGIANEIEMPFGRAFHVQQSHITFADIVII
jgi:putative membrane protein